MQKELFEDSDVFLPESHFSVKSPVKVSGVWRLLDRWKRSGWCLGVPGRSHVSQTNKHSGCSREVRARWSFLLVVVVVLGNQQSLCHAV